TAPYPSTRAAELVPREHHGERTVHEAPLPGRTHAERGLRLGGGEDERGVAVERAELLSDGAEKAVCAGAAEALAVGRVGDDRGGRVLRSDVPDIAGLEPDGAAHRGGKAREVRACGGEDVGLLVAADERHVEARAHARPGFLDERAPRPPLGVAEA